MKQKSFATTGFKLIAERTRKREFLDEMNLVVPWTELIALIEPHAPSGKTGRPTVCGGHDAAHSFPAAVVWPERSGNG